MRKIIFWVHTSIDGHIDGPNGEFDWPVMGEELSAYSEALSDRSDTFLYGRGVWEGMVAFWPNAESMSDHPHVLKFAPLWRDTPKIVFSRTLKETDWATRIIGGDLAEQVAELKRQDGKDLLLTGGSNLAAALTDHGLIDEYHIAVHPVVLGGGRPLFVPRDERLGLRAGRVAYLRFAGGGDAVRPRLAEWAVNALTAAVTPNAPPDTLLCATPGRRPAAPGRPRAHLGTHSHAP